ncbi:MAG: CotH kinase family protein [Flavobacteriales bacterium]|nr:CotH kinase family protein [Flavobacteriales bacterium]MCC6937805.1 CotH kinase family protein [Flavobacteriales bacterium]
MKALFRITLLLALVLPRSVAAQDDLYDLGSVREIRLYFDQANWSDLMDTLFLADEDGRLLGDLVIDGTLIPDVGVRYKGYSSYSPNRIKNPFNIKLNYVHVGQRYQGVDKIKLSNVIQDPSFVRETLSYTIARRYMPASRANFANVYVNDVLIGLYTNVEDVDKGFVDRHYGARGNAFFKGNPSTVDLNGENSNLSDSPGTDSTAYYGLYSMESDHGWGELLELIDVLNNNPTAIESVLNVDRTLWMHALNYTLINFDSYVGYAQNYYLYKDDNARWNPILWDMNMSFASFRLTDASLYWNGFNITQAINMDPLQHHNNVSVIPRPLMRNLFANAMYRRMYLAHMRTIVEENILSGSYRTEAEAMRAVITPSVLADPNKFYSDQAYQDNLDQTVADLIDYPGITQLMDQRATFLMNYPGMTGQPVIGEPTYAPEAITVGGELTITAAITASDTAFLAYRFNDGGLFQTIAMRDDGQNGDGAANDGVYGARITTTTNTVEYYLYAENATAGAFSPPRAAYEFHRITTRISPGDLVINEFMASNSATVVDEFGDADDWVELFNPGPATLSTSGLFLSDDPSDPLKWALPIRTLAPGDYLTLWCDGQPDQGEVHANFKLNAAAGSITLAYDADAVIDQVGYGPQYPISSTGRYPNGTGSFRELFPTFNAFNTDKGSEDLDRYLRIFPNPSNGDVFAIVDEEGPYELNLFTADGRAVMGPAQRTTRELITIPTITMARGLYILEVRTDRSSTRRTFILSE